MNKLVCYSVDKCVYNQIKNKNKRDCLWGTILNLCPDRRQSLVEWGNFHPFVHPSKSSVKVIRLSHQARPEAQHARPQAQPDRPQAQPAKPQASGLACWASGLAGWAPGLAGWPRGGNK